MEYPENGSVVQTHPATDKRSTWSLPSSWSMDIDLLPLCAAAGAGLSRAFAVYQ